MDKLKDAFNKKAPNVSIEIQESGSSAGISQQSGAVEIGMSSRELKDEEKTDLTVKQIAMDGIAVIVNNDNTLDNITSDQIKDIYTGKTTEWSDVK
ncbi:MAG: substrate-binding domain-containing protein [Eubacterium sp.]